jgi:hypothetical protein
MLANAAKLALITAAVTLFATSADAQGNARRCAKSKDKVKCECFYANNGMIEWRSGRRRAVLWSLAEADGYIACLKRHGRS